MLKRYFTHVPEGYITIWAKHLGGQEKPRTFWFDLAQPGALQKAQEAALRPDLQDWEVYFSTCPARARGGTRTRIKAENVLYVPAFFVDFDTQLDPAKRGEALPLDIAEAVGALDALPCPPTLIVFSGHGAQALWILSEPWRLDTPGDVKDCQTLMECFAHAVETATGYTDLDTGASEPARVLRVPGTHNHKYGDALPVYLIDRPEGPNYTLEELGAFMEAHPSSGSDEGHKPFVLPEEIPEGTRDETVFRYGCSLRARGFEYEAILTALQEVNETRCIPPLDDATVERKADQATRYEAGRSYAATAEEDFGPPKPRKEIFFGRKGAFLHNVMGDHLIREHSVCIINGTPHVYDNGIYRQGQDSLYGYMLELVPNLTAAKRREVYEYIKVSRRTPHRTVAPPNLIPFKSRIYNLADDAFMDYTPDLVFLNRFPYDYLPDAPEEPLVSDTIARIADHDQEVVNLLYEAIGNCFYLLNAYRGAAMLHGESGNNGKSTLLNMINQLIGPENASYLSLQDTAERFRLVEMYGKAVNIGDDISAEYLQDSSIFKKLVTGERVMVEKKGQDAFAFKNFAKMFFAMNKLPPVSDKSKAFFGRLLLIPLTHDFTTDGTADVALKDRTWTRTEMEYLLRLAMDGLRRLMRQGAFTKPAKVAEAVADYERDNNPVLDFLEEYGVVEGKSTKEVYWAFKAWCADAGHKNPMTRRRFTDAVVNTTGLRSGAIRDQATQNVIRGYVLR